MMELYIHIPFCVKKCNYCDFVSFTEYTCSIMESYVDDLLLEAKKSKEEVTEPFSTIFIGGGTPSLLPSKLLEKLIYGLKTLFCFEKNAEFTIEANPRTVTSEWLQCAARCGINRLSLGMQASQDKHLSLLGRIHRFPDVAASVDLARKAGFRNINLDLIFGFPKQTQADWAECLEAAISLKPEHISAYGLIPEKGTKMEAALASGELVLPDSETERKMYDYLKKRLAKEGFIQYEISNFSLPGKACRHNIGYWTQVPYLGLGVSASSMLKINHTAKGMSYVRKTNPCHMKAYADYLQGKTDEDVETEKISPEDARFETMMLGLRMNQGVSSSDFCKIHGKTIEACFGEKLKDFQDQGLIQYSEGRWFLTDRGFDIQNSILVELMT